MIITAADFDFAKYQSGEYGDHCIIHGDCRDVLPKIPDKAIDLVLTDPPYGIMLGNHGAFNGNFSVIGDCDLGCANAVKLWCEKININTVMFCSPDNPIPGDWNNRLVWHKRGRGLGGDWEMCWLRDWEMILVNTIKAIRKKESSVLDFTPANCDNHKCEKPVKLISYLLSQLSEQSSIILDPFLGSGTTLVAAKNLGRRAIGIEINYEYCKIAEQRLAQEVLSL